MIICPDVTLDRGNALRNVIFGTHDGKLAAKAISDRDGYVPPRRLGVAETANWGKISSPRLWEKGPNFQRD